MKIIFGFTLWRWRIGSFDLHVDIDKTNETVRPVVDRGVKGVSRWWTRHMAS